jgi:hypothetical protein
MKKISSFIGIDIGKKGAIVALDPQGIIRAKWKMPLDDDRELCYDSLYNILNSFENARVVMEDIGAIHLVGKTSYGVLMKQAGAVEMGCLATGLVSFKVNPRKWQKEMFDGIEELRKPDGGRDTKAMALQAALKSLNTSDLMFKRGKVPHDGLVDAYLMAEYCRRNYG